MQASFKTIFLSSFAALAPAYAMNAGELEAACQIKSKECEAFILGLKGGVEITYATGRGRRLFCINEPWRMEELRAVFVDFMATRPDLRDRDAEWPMALAFATKYECPDK